MPPSLTLSIAGVITGLTWIFVEIAAAKYGPKNEPTDDFSDASGFVGDPRAREVLFHEPLNNPEVRHDHG